MVNMEVRYSLRFEFQLPSLNIGMYLVKLIQMFRMPTSRPSSANLHWFKFPYKIETFFTSHYSISSSHPFASKMRLPVLYIPTKRILQSTKRTSALSKWSQSYSRRSTILLTHGVIDTFGQSAFLSTYSIVLWLMFKPWNVCFSTSFFSKSGSFLGQIATYISR